MNNVRTKKNMLMLGYFICLLRRKKHTCIRITGDNHCCMKNNTCMRAHVVTKQKNFSSVLQDSSKIKIEEKQPITNKNHQTKIFGTIKLEENSHPDCHFIKPESLSLCAV